MEILDITANPTFSGDIQITLTVPQSAQTTVEELLAIDKGNLPQYELKVLKKRNRRSLDANAYMWVLCDKLAKKLNTAADEIYKEMINRYGTSEIVPIRADAVQAFIDKWQSQGLGNMCLNLGDCRRTEGYQNIKIFFGSSTYNTKEMSVLIDGIVTEAKEQGIETLPSEELERLKESWK